MQESNWSLIVHSYANFPGKFKFTYLMFLLSFILSELQLWNDCK